MDEASDQLAQAAVKARIELFDTVRLSMQQKMSQIKISVSGSRGTKACKRIGCVLSKSAASEILNPRAPSEPPGQPLDTPDSRHWM